MYNIEVKFQLEDKEVYLYSTRESLLVGSHVIVPSELGGKKGVVVGQTLAADTQYEEIISSKTARARTNRTLKKIAEEIQFKLTDKAFEEYRKNTKSNRTIDRKKAELKLNRNIILGTVYKSPRGESNNLVRFDYGRMRIYVDIKTNEIVNVINWRTNANGWEMNYYTYLRLNNKFGL